MLNFIHVKRDVLYTQAFGCWFCLQLGSTAIYVGRRNGYAIRLEAFTPLHRWRLSWRAALQRPISRTVKP